MKRPPIIDRLGTLFLVSLTLQCTFAQTQPGLSSFNSKLAYFHTLLWSVPTDLLLTNGLIDVFHSSMPICGLKSVPIQVHKEHPGNAQTQTQ